MAASPPGLRSPLSQRWTLLGQVSTSVATSLRERPARRRIASASPDLDKALALANSIAFGLDLLLRESMRSRVCPQAVVIG